MPEQKPRKENPDPAESRDTESTTPITDEASKSVMLIAERGDSIRINEIVDRFRPDFIIPDELSVVRRISRYYGPELMLYAEIQGTSKNYKINAPGPGSYLHIWKAETENGLRKSYTRVAEVKATVLDGSYEFCPECGDPLKTRRHERLSAIGRCPNS